MIITSSPDTTIRASMVQFIGAILSSYPNGEVAMGLVMEELVKLSMKDNDVFDNDMIKPMLKAVVYILTVRHNKLLEDAKTTFQSNIPDAIQKSLDSQKELIDSLNKYIGELI